MEVSRVTFIGFAECCLLSATVAFAQNNLIQPVAELQKELKGKLERITVHAKSLEGNLEGDSADRDVFVYLPPSYEKESGPPLSGGLHASRFRAARAAMGGICECRGIGEEVWRPGRRRK